MTSDIAIAQRAKMLRITEVAQRYNVEKATLGDLDALKSLKEDLEKEGK